MKKFLITTILLSFVTYYSNSQDLNNIIKEIDSTFTINSKAINPNIIKDFAGSIADRYPAIFSIDVLNSNNSNKYSSYPCEKVNNGTGIICSDEDNQFLSLIEYKWLGQLKNGVHVVFFSENGGGSFTLFRLLCFRFEEATYLDGFQELPQIRMNLIRDMCLRSSEVTLLKKKNEIIVHKSCDDDKTLIFDLSGF